jgi:heme A synthase
MFVFVWFVLAIFVAIGAGNRGRNVIGWFVLACIISPVLAGLGLLVAGDAAGWSPGQYAAADETKKCPECAETILKAARKCKHCGSEVPQEA